MRCLTTVSCGLSVACANPITNLPFYEDAELVAALPYVDRFGVPNQVRLARVGTSQVLEDAVGASADYQSVVETLLRSGEVLRNAEPDVRSDVGRGWDAVQASGDLSGTRFSWWVRGDVLRVADGGDTVWTIEVAADADGPFFPAGEGRHDPGGYGDGTWDLTGIVEILEEQTEESSDPVGLLTFDYEDDSDANGTRVVSVEHTMEADLLGSWTAVGQVALAWFGPSQILDPPLPAAIQVVHDDNGGWAVGEVYDGDAALTLTTCWSPVGDTVFAEGSALDDPDRAQLAAVGQRSDCPTPYPF